MEAVEPGPAGETAGSVARRLGIVPSTLRTWNRRYGIGPPEHEAGRYRYYTEADVAEVAAMKALIEDGTPPVVAARLARRRRPVLPVRPGTAPRRSRRAVEAAVMRMDADTVTNAFVRSVDEVGVLRTWHGLYRPIMGRVGRHVFGDGTCLDVERLLSWSAVASLHRVPRPTRPPTAPRIVLACAEGEQHSVGLEVVHAALAERGVSSDMLGPSVMWPALHGALGRAPTAVVVVSASSRQTARTSALKPLVDLAAQVVAAGPGWRGRSMPNHVVTADTVEQVLDVCTATAAEVTLGGPARRPAPRQGQRI